MGRDRDSRDTRDSHEGRISRDYRDSRDHRDRGRHRDRSRSRSRSRSRDRRASHRDDRHRDRSPARDNYDRERNRDTRSYRDSREPSPVRTRPHQGHKDHQLESLERKGLNVEVHPLLASNIDPAKMQSGSISLIPKASTSTTMANQRAAAAAVNKVVKKTKKGLDPVDAFLAIKPTEPSRSNPYFDPRISSSAHMHTARAIKFQPKGKFVAQANQMRREAQMEVLRRDIAETALESGLDVDIVGDLMIGDASVVPKAEWWDLPFLPADNPLDISLANHTLVNNLIQRPALLDPPADLNVLVAPKPLALTKDELKKMRRQRRLVEHQEHQEKIRLGLLPPDEPKIRLANLATVLANESVQDPTKIEAEIRAQAAARHDAHLKANQERKEQAEIASKNKAKPDLPLVNVAVYQIDRIDHNQWKYKIKTNAIQDGLTGCAIISPKTNIIIVEGTPKGLKHYKGLLTRRINWNEPPPPIDGAEMSVEPQELNSCKLLWEGTVAKASWTWFEMKQVQADIDVKDFLVSKGLEQYWNLTRS